VSKESRAIDRENRRAVQKAFDDNDAAYRRSQDMRRRGLDPSRDDNPAVARINGPDGSGTTFFAAWFRP
jgi:hypothetical protein